MIKNFEIPTLYVFYYLHSLYLLHSGTTSSTLSVSNPEQYMFFYLKTYFPAISPVRAKIYKKDFITINPQAHHGVAWRDTGSEILPEYISPPANVVFLLQKCIVTGTEAKRPQNRSCVD